MADESAAKPMRKKGRPSAYNPELHPQLAEAWAAAGKTEPQIAEIFGVVQSTISKWKTEHPEFSEALKRGKILPDDLVERSLFQRAIGYNHEAVKIFMPAGAKKPVYAPYIEHTVPDVTAQIFWLKNRRPDRWRDRHEVTGSEGGPFEIVTLTPEERAARIADIVAKANA